jgi:hypothetical protein
MIIKLYLYRGYVELYFWKVSPRKKLIIYRPDLTKSIVLHKHYSLIVSI